jgi:hypothetical protein
VLLATAAILAFVDVAVLPMDRNIVEWHQTVLVQGDRIAAVGPVPAVVVPADAVVIQGRDRFLLPGLTDAHVHLNTGLPWAPARDDFGDAPLYLANGITTVFNLSGSAEQLDWRRRVADGSLIGPTIYTSGPFINEPRFTTPQAVRDEVGRQAAAGFDLIKFHELDDTTTGLSVEAYRALNEAAAAVHLPLIGHAPNRLGVDAMFRERQSLAHVGNLVNIYFMPIVANVPIALATAVAFLAVLIAPFFKWRQRRASALAALVALAAGGVLASTLPGGPLWNSTVARAGATAAVAALGVVGVTLLRRRSFASIPPIVLAALLGSFWTPVMWRSSNAGIAAIASRVHDAGMSVESTLVVYDALTRDGRRRLLDDPAIQYLHPAARRLWRSASAAGTPGERIPAFNRKLLFALHRSGVPIVAGTDAMGIDLVTPGSSLHRELRLLTAAGLTPFEALHAATVAPAIFIHREREFGTIAVGRRADLLLVDANPLVDLNTLADPEGVVVRGRWIARAELQRMLAALAAES